MTSVVDQPGLAPADLDLKSLPNVHDPFPVYRWLRDHDPVHWSSTLNGWVVTRFADVIEIFNRPGRFASDRFRKIDERYASQRPAVKALAEELLREESVDADRLRALLAGSVVPNTIFPAAVRDALIEARLQA